MGLGVTHIEVDAKVLDRARLVHHVSGLEAGHEEEGGDRGCGLAAVDMTRQEVREFLQVTPFKSCGLGMTASAYWPEKTHRWRCSRP